MSVKRREFLKVVGVTGAGAGLVGCSTEGVEKLLPYVVAPEEITPGVASWYASVCQECSAGCGIWVRTREGRVVKVEGNPFHPVSQGGLCTRGQASVQGLYNPDRYASPMVREGGSLKPISWDEAEAMLAQRLQGAAAGSVLLITGNGGGPALNAVYDAFTAARGGRRIVHEGLADAPLREATRIAYGVDALPRYDFAAARMVISFGADFLESWHSPVEYTRGFATTSVASEGGDKAMFVFVGPRLSLTGQNADTWVPINPGSEAAVALAIANIVAAKAGQPTPYDSILGAYGPAAVAQASGVPEGVLQELATAFTAQGPTLAVGTGIAGQHRNATAANLAVLVLNAVAGNVGRTVFVGEGMSPAPASRYAEMEATISAMAGGSVAVAMVHGTNPAFTLPAASGFTDAFKNVQFKVSFASAPDETSELADLILPDRHFLEAWGDSSPRGGVHAIQQPAMQPVPHFETKQTGDVLLSVATRAGTDLGLGATMFDHLKTTWGQVHAGGARVASSASPVAGVAAGTPEEVAAQVAGAAAAQASSAHLAAQSNFDVFWRQALRRGVAEQTVTAAATPALRAPESALAFDTPQLDGEGMEFTLVVHPSPRVGDGALNGNIPWLHELPDPVSKISWHSWVEINPVAAERLGVRDGDIVRVTSPHGELEVPVWIYPGIREDVVSIQMGSGHTAAGRYAANNEDWRTWKAFPANRPDQRRVNPMVLLPAVAEQPSGGLVHVATRVTVEPTGVGLRLATIAGSDEQHGRKVADAVSLQALMSGGGEAEAEGEGAHGGPRREINLGGGFVPVPTEGRPEDFPLPGSQYGGYANPEETPRWAMAIDLDKCTGCSACVVACQAENNVPFVGEDQVRMGRELSWIRLDRFYENVDSTAAGAVDVRHLPMLCQHCGNAPCEPVCPVFAAYHTPDGINGQVYNRCVGTRYCANNCPYKVRVFNWYTYTDLPEPLNWQYNPDVTVRENGVMEKCSFCVQRVREAQNKSRIEGRGLADGDVVTACQQTCPAEAIVFGNIRDETSRISQVARGNRTYRVFDDVLNTQPGVMYLKKVTFHEPLTSEEAEAAAEEHVP
jgi:anaerobic selenocysteine-containing dehydrogenase/Fe-S-cluster-containing dehydrogenase component